MTSGLERLVELRIEHYAKIPDTHRQLLPLRPVHYLNATQRAAIVIVGSITHRRPADVRTPRVLRDAPHTRATESSPLQ